jgi:hypothetical protein
MKISNVMREEVDGLSSRIFMTLETMVRASATDGTWIRLNVPIANFHDSEELCCIGRRDDKLFYWLGAEIYTSEELYSPSIEGMVNVIAAIEDGNYIVKPCDSSKKRALKFWSILSMGCI